MAIPFYYNPATNELELTADPSPLRDSLGERFGLNEIPTRAKTLSPTKSYVEKPYNWEEGDWTDPNDDSVGGTKILEDFVITDEMRRKPNAAGGRIGLKEGTPNKAWDLTKKVGKYGIARPIAGITLPVVKAGESVVETVKAVKEKRLPDYNLTDPNTWVNAAFWNWAVKEWGFDKTVKNFGESLKHLSKGDKARVFRNVVARAGLSPKAIQVIGSRVAWPVAGAMSVYDAYKDYQKRKPDIEKQKELIEQGVVKEEEFDKEEPMFAKGGRIGVKKK